MTQSRYLPLNSTTNSTGYRFLDISDVSDSIALDFINAKISGTSTTSLAIGTGTKTLIVNTGLPIYTSQSVLISNTVNTMSGTVSTYDNSSGVLVCDIAAITGSGTFTAWTVTCTGDFRLSRWLDLVDGEILSLAQEKEVPLTAISIPLHKKINEYCCAYFCFVCFQDAFGRNDIAQTDQETIKKKLEWYEGRCARLRLQCTKEMFLYTNLSLIASQRVGGTVGILRA